MDPFDVGGHPLGVEAAGGDAPIFGKKGQLPRADGGHDDPDDEAVWFEELGEVAGDGCEVGDAVEPSKVGVDGVILPFNLIQIGEGALLGGETAV